MQSSVKHGAAFNIWPTLNSQSPHHVKVSLTIGPTTSLIEWMALKWALTHTAHMMLCVHVKERGREYNMKT